MSASQVFTTLAPFLLAALLALVPALVEVLRTFGRRVGFVLRSAAGWAILGVNAATGLITYAAVKYLFGVSNDLLTAAIVGLTFPTVLRSPLTFVKGVEKADAEFKENALHALANLYDQLLGLAREDADAIQADERTRISVKLASKHSATALARQVQWRISEMVREEARERRQQELDQALTVPDELDRGVAVARVALDVVPGSTIREWLRRRKPL
jgi:hypothetical protein